MPENPTQYFAYFFSNITGVIDSLTESNRPFDPVCTPEGKTFVEFTASQDIVGKVVNLETGEITDPPPVEPEDA